MKPSRIVVIVLGSIMALIGFALFVGGAALGWAVGTQRDDDGFFSTSEDRFETETYALTSDEIDLGSPGPDDWWADRDLATVRITADLAGSGDVFVGIGPEVDVEAYLADVPHDEVTDVDYHPFDADYRREHADGTATPALPEDQAFWVARAAGPGAQTLTWDLEPGHWAIVVMNADASQSVAADLEFGGRIDYLAQLAIGLAVGGGLLLALGVVLIVRAASGGEEGRPAAPAPAAGAYPVRLEGHLDPDVSRWQWLVKWFLAIPHFVVLVFLWIAFVVLTILAGFAILFTGRYPRRWFDFNVGVLRWTWRVGYYATSALGTDRYPPFTLQADDYPAQLDIAYPEHLSRGLVLVKSWLLAIPHLAIVGVLTAGWTLGRDDRWFVLEGGLLGVLLLVVAGALLFTGRYPTGLHDFVMGINRWSYRVIAYVALMTDRYPPFRLDQGASEPPAELAPPTIADALPPPVHEETT
ncbi:MAG: DUF4389 domain-containing protein [Ilumatobacteraceae bacterium]